MIIVDNLSRRDIDNELGCSSLTPIESPEIRVKTWEQVSGRTMRFVNLDVAKDFAELVQVGRCVWHIGEGKERHGRPTPG